jgi:hypothetical protein
MYSLSATEWLQSGQAMLNRWSPFTVKSIIVIPLGIVGNQAIMQIAIQIAAAGK